MQGERHVWPHRLVRSRSCPARIEPRAHAPRRERWRPTASHAVVHCAARRSHLPPRLIRDAQVSPAARHPPTIRAADSPATASWRPRCSECSAGSSGGAARVGATRLATCSRSPSPPRIKERDGEPIHHPRAFLREVIVNQRKMELRSERRHPASSFDELASTAETAGGPWSRRSPTAAHRCPSRSSSASWRN